MTKRDDDKADTSRMNDDKDKVVEMTDEDEVEIMETQVSSYGHKPLVGYTGMRVSTRPHRNLDRRQQTNVVFEEDQDADLGRTTTAYIHV